MILLVSVSTALRGVAKQLVLRLAPPATNHRRGAVSRLSEDADATVEHDEHSERRAA